MLRLEFETKAEPETANQNVRSSRPAMCNIRGPRLALGRLAPTATVLWIDDDPADWAQGAAHLKRCGYRVVPLPATERGVEWVAAVAPDVIVLEVCLRQGDGMGLLRSIRADNPSLPILIYSRSDRYRDDFTSWLANDYLVKAENYAPLCDAIEWVLASRRDRAR